MSAFRHNRKLFKAMHKLYHFLGAAGAAVVAKHIHRLAAAVLINISIPIFLNLAGHIPCYKMSGRNAGINIRAVYSLPNKVIVREAIGIIPSRHFV